MKLIDADELLSYIDRVKNSGLGKQKTIEYITKYISNMPTAFDVDKVVEQLERKRDYHYKQMKEVDFEKDIFAQHIFEEEHNRGIGLSEAIEIVKVGGIDETRNIWKSKKFAI